MSTADWLKVCLKEASVLNNDIKPSSVHRPTPCSVCYYCLDAASEFLQSTTTCVDDRQLSLQNIYGANEPFTEEQVQQLGFREELAGAAEGLTELRKRGVRILGGGDYGFGLTPHGNNARDLDHLIKYCHFDSMEALLTMTKHGGAAMDMGDELGQIQEGFLADLLLIDGNPLEDPKMLMERDRLQVVMKDGCFHKNSM